MPDSPYVVMLTPTNGTLVPAGDTYQVQHGSEVDNGFVVCAFSPQGDTDTTVVVGFVDYLVIDAS